VFRDICIPVQENECPESGFGISCAMKNLFKDPYEADYKNIQIISFEQIQTAISTSVEDRLPLLISFRAIRQEQ